MNIVNKLTLRQLTLNKKRTLVTIIGTIISAAMITAVATLGLSFIDIMIRESIHENGEWHARYLDVNQEQFETVQSDSRISTSMMGRNLGYSYLDGSDNGNKPYLYIMEYDKTGFDNFPIELTEGRLPENPKELVISEGVITNAKVDYQIGDVLPLSIGDRVATIETKNDELGQIDGLIWDENTVGEHLTEKLSKEYTIVGIIKSPDWEYTWAPGYSAISYLDENTVTSTEQFDVSVIFRKVNNKLFDHAKEILPNHAIEYNNELLRYMGVYADDAARKTIYMLSAIIMVIIVIGSVALIYNAFAISVAERSRYLGMLASVGATKRQKRNSVFFEGAVIGLISIPIGIASGYLGLGVTYIFINPLIKGALGVAGGFQLRIYPTALVASLVISALTILISTYLPARKASNISAIDAIRQSTEVKIRKRQVKTSRLTRALFGIEGDLGLKNLKRNRGRYKATIFSLVISMMLFLVVTQFTNLVRQSYTMTQDGINFDITAMVNGTTKEKNDVVNKITSLENIKDYSRVDYIDASTWLGVEEVADYLKTDTTDPLQEDRYNYQVIVNALEEEALEAYAKKIGVDYELFNDPALPAAIVIDQVTFKDAAADKYVRTKVVKTAIGKEYDLYLPAEDEEVSLGKVKVAGTTDQLPMGIMSSGGGTIFHIIISKEAYDRMISQGGEIAQQVTNTVVYFNSSKPLKLQQAIEKVQESVGVSKLSLYNLYLYRQREGQMMLLINVFTYAFLILITAICIANIINTISTSIALRKREFAMLKSVGITPKSFNKMLNFESIFYGLKALIYGLPISIAVMYLIYQVLMDSFEFAFTLPIRSICIVIVAVFLIVGIAMLYSSNKVRKENIIDALRQEII
ncbi:MAG: cell division protein FtsX [Herbinix sp.]|nr:cell division protein FtsX [Herbinix sp.]